MKKFLDEYFKPYLFPILLLLIAAYIRAGENLAWVTNFFSESTYGFIKFFNRQFYVWEVILYFLVAFISLRIYKYLFRRKSKKERSMIKATKRIPHAQRITINGTNDTFLFKFDPKVIDEEYFIDKLRPYCLDCSPTGLRMSGGGLYGGGDFKCNCGKTVDFWLWRDVKSGIITDLENIEGV